MKWPVVFLAHGGGRTVREVGPSFLAGPSTVMLRLGVFIIPAIKSLVCCSFQNSREREEVSCLDLVLSCLDTFFKVCFSIVNATSALTHPGFG
jgi:hypothetical protein